jgi:hypothetical protein
MKHFKIIDEEYNDEERTLAVVAIDFLSGEPIPELQLQVAQDGNDSYIDLSVDEVEGLVNKLNEFLGVWQKKEAQH